MRIYVASSWRNLYQPTVVTALRQEGYEVYDFRYPLRQTMMDFIGQRLIQRGRHGRQDNIRLRCSTHWRKLGLPRISWRYR